MPVPITFRATTDERDAYNAAAKSANLPLSTWIRQACEALARPQNATPSTSSIINPVSRPEPVLHGQTALRFKPAKDCSGRCRRIGAPSCDPCRKANAG